MLMQLNRDYVHVAKNGLSIQFKPGVPTHVPPKLVPDVIGLGGTVSETDQAAVDSEMKVIEAARIEADGRQPAIEAGIRKLIARNQRGDFTAGGRPNLNVLAKELGFLVSSEELEPCWAKCRAEVA